jgi:hypothetical protein
MKIYKVKLRSTKRKTGDFTNRAVPTRPPYYSCYFKVPHPVTVSVPQLLLMFIYTLQKLFMGNPNTIKITAKLKIFSYIILILFMFFSL